MFAQLGLIRELLAGNDSAFVIRVNGVAISRQLGDPFAKVLAVVFPILFWGIGLALIYAIKNYKLTTTDEGIEVVSFFGKRWGARWEDLEVIKRGSDNFDIRHEGNRAWAQGSMVGFTELKTEIESHMDS